MRQRIISVAVAVMVVVIAIILLLPDRDTPPAPQYGGKNWPTIHGDYADTRHSTLSAINTENVAQLGGAWSMPFQRGDTSRATPVVTDGKMFVTTTRFAYALNPTSGEVIWSHAFGTPAQGLFKGVAVGEGKVFVGLSDGSMIALDAKTGEQLWEGFVADHPPRRGQFISGAPLYANGVVIGLLANGHYVINGRAVALDANTGEEVWRFNAVPEPGEFGHDTWPQDTDVWKGGGAGGWVTPTADMDLGLVYVGFGNPVPQWGGEARAGDNLFADTVVALDIKTGERKWHYQLVRHDIWEQDVRTPLIAFNADFDGEARRALGVIRTDGLLFVLDRETGEPILPVEERPVPQNERLHTVPTQPFPVGADQIGPNCTPADMIPAGFKIGCYYEPIDYDQPNVIVPQHSVRAAPASYSPQTDYIYVAASVAPYWVWRTEDPLFFTVGRVPGIKAYGLLVAVDTKTAKIAWQKRMPYSLQNGSGSMTTAGGLMFHGEPDGNVQAYDAANGNLLWEFQAGADVIGPPMTYEANGERFVGVVTRNSIWAFNVGGEISVRPAPPEPSRFAPYSSEGFAGRVIETNEIAMSGIVNDLGLEKPREFNNEYVFEPLRARVNAGTIVTWTNTGEHPHDATGVDGTWTTGNVAPGKSVKVTFNKPGAYTYICRVHPWTYAEIIVED